MNVNNIQLTGALGKNPETKQSGYKSFYVCSMGHTPYSKKDEEKKPTTWVDLLAFGPAAKQMAGMQKGDIVYVCGKLMVKKDEKYTNVTIMVDVIQKIPKKSETDEPEQFKPAAPPRSVNIDDIPF